MMSYNFPIEAIHLKHAFSKNLIKVHFAKINVTYLFSGNADQVYESR